MERAPAAEASHGRSGELPARPVDGTECVLFRRRGAGGQQRVGTGDEARGAEPQELALRGQPARRKNRGDSGQPGLDLPPPPGGSAALLHATAPAPAAAARRPAPHEITRTAWPSRRLAPRPVETGASCPIHRSGNPRSSHHALAPVLHVPLTKVLRKNGARCSQIMGAAAAGLCGPLFALCRRKPKEKDYDGGGERVPAYGVSSPSSSDSEKQRGNRKECSPPVNPQ